MWLLRSYLYLFLWFSSLHTLLIVSTLSLNLFCLTRTRLSIFVLKNLGITCLFWDVKCKNINIRITRKTPIIQQDLAVFVNLFRYSLLSFSYMFDVLTACESLFWVQKITELKEDIKESFSIKVYTCCCYKRAVTWPKC